MLVSTGKQMGPSRRMGVRQRDRQAEPPGTSWSYKTCPEDKMEQSECAEWGCCMLHALVYEAFIAVTLEIAAEPGIQ